MQTHRPQLSLLNKATHLGNSAILYHDTASNQLGALLPILVKAHTLHSVRPTEVQDTLSSLADFHL